MTTEGDNDELVDAIHMQQQQETSMFYDLPVMRIQGQEEGVNYQPHPRRMTTQSFAAKVTEICNQLPKFGGKEGESVEKFIKNVDACMTNMHISSKEAAAALFSHISPLHGRAATFVNFARTDPKLYPHAEYWCAQDEQERVDAVPYQKRRDSVATIASSHPSEKSEESRDTQPSIATVESDQAAGTHKVNGAHNANGTIRTDPRTKSIHNQHSKPAQHKRKGQRGRDEIPAQPAMPAQPRVDEKQCLRHYLLGEFYVKANRDEALKKFEAAKLQPPRMSVREYIWRLKMAHDDYRKARWGHQAEARQEKYKEEDEETLTTIIKLNTIAEFKQFFQPKLSDNQHCMDTVRQCLKMAAHFETLTEAGKRHTASCHSAAHVAQVMAATPIPQPQSLMTPAGAYPETYFSQHHPPETSLQAMSHIQGMPSAAFPQPASAQPAVPTYLDQSRSHMASAAAPAPYRVPDGLVSEVTPEAWAKAVEIATARSALRWDTENDAAYAAAAAATPNSNGRGNGSNKRGGGKGNGKTRGGKANNGALQTTPQSRPPPIPVPQGASEYWHRITPMEEAACAYKNPNGMQRCGYCGVTGHGYSNCGYKRSDLKAMKNYNVHPNRGSLPPKKASFNKWANFTRSKGVSAVNGPLTFSDFVLANPLQQQQQIPNAVPQPSAAAAAISPREQELLNMLAQTNSQLAQLQMPSQQQVPVSAVAKVATARMLQPEGPAGPVVPMPIGYGQPLKNWADDLEPQPALPPARSTKEKDEAFDKWMAEQYHEQQLRHEDMLRQRQKRQQEEAAKQRLLQKPQASMEAQGELEIWHRP